MSTECDDCAAEECLMDCECECHAPTPEELAESMARFKAKEAWANSPSDTIVEAVAKRLWHRTQSMLAHMEHTMFYGPEDK